MTSSFFFSWIALELRLVIFLLALKSLKVQHFAQECVHYFVIQALASTLILYFWLRSTLNTFSRELILLGLSIKIGIFPFHSWYLNLINFLDWGIIWVLRIPIKLVILKIIFSIGLTFAVTILAFVNVMFSFIRIFKEKKIKLFLALTSIFNIGWVLLSLIDLIAWIIFMIVYRINLYVLLDSLKINFRETLFNLNNAESKSIHLMIIVVGLIIMRIPPTLGFIVKIIVIFLVINDFFLIRSSILLTSVIIRYYYLIIFYYLNLSLSKPISIFRAITGFIWKFLNLNVILSLVMGILISYYLNNNLCTPAPKSEWLLKRFLKILVVFLKQTKTYSYSKFLKLIMFESLYLIFWSP